MLDLIHLVGVAKGVEGDDPHTHKSVSGTLTIIWIHVALVTSFGYSVTSFGY